MLGIFLGTIVGILYFTYKPLFKHLKEQSYSPKNLYISIKDNAKVREEFKNFSYLQMQRIKQFLAKFQKKEQEQDNAAHKEEVAYKVETQENTQSHTLQEVDKNTIREQK